MIRRRTTRRVREKIFPSLAVVAVVTVVTVVAVARATSACVFSTVHPTPSTSSIPPSAHAPRTRPARSRSRARARPVGRLFHVGRAKIFCLPPPARRLGRAIAGTRAPSRARDIRARVFEINFLESPLVVSPPGVDTIARWAPPGPEMVLFTYTVQKYHIHRKTPISHTVTTPDILEPAVSTTPRRSVMKRTDIRNDRPRGRPRDGWMVGRARARDATSDRATRGVDRAALYFLPPPPPPRRVVARGDGRRSTPALPRIDPPIQYRGAARAFSASTLRGDGEGANARARTTTMMMMTSPTETAPMPISSRARSVSEDGDDDVAAKRRHSFSTDCSARTIAVDGARLHDDRSSPIPDDDATREDARRCVNGEEKISLDALRALAEANADVARPDGFELHADVCATLLASERARGRDAVVTVDVGRAHHAPYRGELVEWILDVCAGERYGPTTADVAIAYTVRPERARARARGARGGDRPDRTGRSP